MRPLLNRKTGPQILRFFDICFKRGVIDACEFGNDIDAKEFLDEKKENWSFGLLGTDDFENDWKPFRFTMYFWARQNKLSALADNYIFHIRKADPTWCLLPYCMRFYLMGIEEWLQYPNPGNLEYFKHNKKIHWDQRCDPKNLTKNDFIYYMQDMAYKYGKLPEEMQPVASVTMDGFCKAVFDITRKYATGSEEDF